MIFLIKINRVVDLLKIVHQVNKKTPQTLIWGLVNKRNTEPNQITRRIFSFSGPKENVTPFDSSLNTQGS